MRGRKSTVAPDVKFANAAILKLFKTTLVEFYSHEHNIHVTLVQYSNDEDYTHFKLKNYTH